MTRQSDARRILVVQTILPHYRLPFFRRLCQSTRFEFTIAYGEARPSDSLQTVADAEGVRGLHLRNRYLIRSHRGGTMRWQSGLLGPLFRREYDVVIAEGDPHSFSTLAAFGLAKLRGMPFIIWWHGIGPRSTRWLHRLRLAWARRADALVFYDAERPKWFIERGIPRDKVFVAWNSIDTDRIAELIADWSAKPRHRILYIGRLIPQKKVDLLVRAFALAAPHLPEKATLTIIGDGPEAAPLRALATDLGISDRVEFTGAITDEEQLAPYFNAAVLCVCPGAVGLALIHSMAYGVPMLVADTEPHGPEIAALAHGNNGLLFPADDVIGLAAGLVDTCGDAARLASMSESARSTVASRYSLAAMVDVFESAVSYVCQVKDE